MKINNSEQFKNLKNENTIAMISLGCPKALVDSEKILTQLKIQNYLVTDNYREADLIIVNTCGFINEAIEESLNTIGQALKQNGKVIVTGCLGAKKSLILKKYPKVLAVTGPGAYDEVVALVNKYLPKEVISSTIYDHNERYKLTPPHYAYLKISEGCNQNCTYCIIPSLRGKLVSRPINEILDEASQLVKNGVKELLVVSQDTGAYGSDLAKTTSLWHGKKLPNNLIALVTELSTFGVWIRLHYLYPYPQIDQLLPLMRDKKIVPYLDIPLQHVNSRILKLMNRPANSSENLLDRIQKWRTICPELTIRSTFIVGFPSETSADFNELLSFLKKAKLDRVGVFKYSKVTGAKANKLPKQISEKIKAERFHQLMTLQQQISRQKLKHRVGKTIDVLIDSLQNHTATGRSFADAPEIDGVVYIKNPNNLKPGALVKVTIDNSDEYDLFGHIA